MNNVGVMHSETRATVRGNYAGKSDGAMDSGVGYAGKAKILGDFVGHVLDVATMLSRTMCTKFCGEVLQDTIPAVESVIFL